MMDTTPVFVGSAKNYFLDYLEDETKESLIDLIREDLIPVVDEWNETKKLTMIKDTKEIESLCVKRKGFIRTLVNMFRLGK